MLLACLSGFWARVSSIVSLLLFAGLFGSSINANEPPATKIDADELLHDEQKLVTEFRGNVNLNRGGSEPPGRCA